MNLLKSRFKVNGVIKSLVCVNFKPEEKKAVLDLNAIHHIHIIDRSGSMSGVIEDLIENIKSTLTVMRDEDFISLLWFSGRGQFKTLIKGAKKSDSLIPLLDSIKSTVGMTHFSEALQECRTIITDLKVICPNFSVTMFTDGCPQESDAPILEQVGLMKTDILAFHTVGYGNYYNKELLQKMSGLSQYGVMVHSSKIGEYLNIFTGNYEMIKEMAGTPIDVDAPNCEIFYLASKAIKSGAEKLKVTASDKNKNQIFIVATDVSEVNFTLNGTNYSATGGKCKEIPEATFKNFLYAYLQQAYYFGEKELALGVAVQMLRSRPIADMILKSFTFDEICWTQKMLNKYVYSVSERAQHENTCGVDYLPAKDAFCLVDLLTILQNSNARYIPSKDYNRVGMKTTDSFNIFKADEKQDYSPFSNFVFNKDKLNMSILFRVTGTVAINPKVAKKNGLPEVIETGIFRNHTIIKDGNLNMETLTALFPSPLDYMHTYNIMCAKSKDKELIASMFIKGEHKEAGTSTVKLDLTKLPITNQKYAEAGTGAYILKLAKNELILSMQQKIVNGLIKRIEAENEKATSKTLRSFTPEQITILEEHGLDKNLNYKGVDNKKADKADADFYFAKTLEFGFKGFSSLPTAEVLVTKGEAKANSIYAELFKFIKQLKEVEKINFTSVAVKTHDKLVSILKDIKTDLSHLRGQIAGIKIAKVLTGANWFDGAVSDGKGNYLYTEDDTTLIISAGEEKVYF